MVSSLDWLPLSAPCCWRDPLLCLAWCDFQELRLVNLRPQEVSLQVYGRAPECDRTCDLRWWLLRKDLSHSSQLKDNNINIDSSLEKTTRICKHLNGFSPVCTLSCLRRSLRVVKNLAQPGCSQLNVVPKWTRWWALRRYRVVKVLSHPEMSHSNGRSLVCTRTWIFRLWEFRKAFPHPSSVHLKVYSPKMKIKLLSFSRW